MLGGRTQTHLPVSQVVCVENSRVLGNNFPNFTIRVCDCYHVPTVFVVWSNVLKKESQHWGKKHTPCSVCCGSVLFIQRGAKCECFRVTTVPFCSRRTCLSWFPCSSYYTLLVFVVFWKHHVLGKPISPGVKTAGNFTTLEK